MKMLKPADGSIESPKEFWTFEHPKTRVKLRQGQVFVPSTDPRLNIPLVERAKYVVMEIISEKPCIIGYIVRKNLLLEPLTRSKDATCNEISLESSPPVPVDDDGGGRLNHPTRERGLLEHFIERLDAEYEIASLSREAALSLGADSLLVLNTYAMDHECSEWFRTRILELKSAFINLLLLDERSSQPLFGIERKRNPPRLHEELGLSDSDEYDLEYVELEGTLREGNQACWDTNSITGYRIYHKFEIKNSEYIWALPDSENCVMEPGDYPIHLVGESEERPPHPSPERLARWYLFLRAVITMYTIGYDKDSCTSLAE